MLGRFLFLAAATALLVAACSDSDTTAAAGPPPHSTTCSNGPAYAANATPPSLPPTVTRSASAPTCVAHCGEEGVIIDGANFSGAPIDALPAGACTAGDDCTMNASNYEVCGPNKVACNLSTFYCDCESGNWACYTVTQGANSCTPCLADGGT